MGKIIAYRALNEDYTDKISGVKLIPWDIIRIPEFTTEMFPITLLNVYQLFGNNEKFVTIEMEDAEVDLPASWCQSDKACVVKEIDNTDLIQEDISIPVKAVILVEIGCWDWGCSCQKMAEESFSTSSRFFCK